MELERGKWNYYTPLKGWIRYGLNVEKFGNSGRNWLGSSAEPGEWAVAFHGLRREVIESVKGIAGEGFHVYNGKNSQWGSTSPDVGRNKELFKDKNCGIGVFCTPKLEYLMENIEGCCLLKPIKYDSNNYIQAVIQCRVRPESIRQPECSEGQYYIINNSTNIRPYGLLVRFLTVAKATEILNNHNFNLNPLTKVEQS